MVRLSALGDVILLLPALRALRQRFPHAHLAVATEPPAASLLQAQSCVDAVISLPFEQWKRGRCRAAFMRRWRRLRRGYDVAIVAQELLKAVLIGRLAAPWCMGFAHRRELQELFLHHRVPHRGGSMRARFLDLVAPLTGSVALPAGPVLDVPAPARTAARAWLGSRSAPGRPVVVCPWSPVPWKRCSVGWWQRVLRALCADGWVPLIDAPPGPGLQLARHLAHTGGGACTEGRFGVIGLLGLLAEADGFVGIDSAPAHLRDGLDGPGVVVWSGSHRATPEVYGPRPVGRVRLLQQSEPRMVAAAVTALRCTLSA